MYISNFDKSTLCISDCDLAALLSSFDIFSSKKKTAYFLTDPILKPFLKAYFDVIDG